MTIVLCGGGSGGHITPLLAVARELRRTHPGVRLIYLGEKGGKFRNLAEQGRVFDEYCYISAGKLRRYHGESWLRKLTDIKTIAYNIRDLFRFAFGVGQGLVLFRRLGADAMLLKGGYVCVPAAIAARVHGVPTITHDSDAVPGLSNRLAARWARYHATAMPAKYYSYPKRSIRVVGVPVDQHFTENFDQDVLRASLDIDVDAEVLLITGGSNGARRMNEAVIDVLPQLFEVYPKLHVIHQYGAHNEDQFEVLSDKYLERMTRFAFTQELYRYSAAADIIVTRAGASAMADFASQGKACILVPNPQLTGGHQSKNAVVYKDQNAAVVVEEQQLADGTRPLYEAIAELIEHPKKRAILAQNICTTLPNEPAAAKLAALLIEMVEAK